MKKLVFLVALCLTFASCMESVREKDRQAEYVIETSKSFLVFSSNDSAYKELRKPVKLNTLKSTNTDLSLIKAAQAHPGMTRFYRGQENNDFDIGAGYGLGLILGGVVVGILLSWLIRSGN